MLGQSGQQPGAPPTGEGRQSGMGGTGHEVYVAVPQRRHGPPHREHHLQLRIYALSLKEPQIYGGNRGEVGIGHQVGYRDAHWSYLLAFDWGSGLQKLVRVPGLAAHPI